MPKQSRKDELLPQARVLCAEGMSKAEVASALHVSRRTIQRWAKQDRDAGRPWRRPGDGEAESPSRGRTDALASSGGDLVERVYAKLQERLEDLVESGEEESGSARVEDRMLKICRVLDYLRSDRDPVGEQLRAMKAFAAFCLRTLNEEQMRPVRKAIRMFLDDLKKENT